MSRLALPSASAPVVDPKTGLMDPAWYQYLSELTRFMNAQLAPSTGWALPTGSLSKATYNTGTVTVTPLAQVVGALQTDLYARGIIGA